MILRVASVVAALVVAGLAVYAAFIEPAWISVTHHSAGKATNFNREIVVVQVSDLHLQSIGKREQSVIREIQLLKADLLVLSGDVIDRKDKLPVLDAFLSMIQASRKVAVLGNWEYWAGVDLDALRDLYAKHDVDLLVNERVLYSFGERTIEVNGLDDFTAGRPALAFSFSGAHDSNVAGANLSLLVQHSPGWFSSPEATHSKHRFSLCLSGHTHGGQITFFGKPIWTPRGSGHFIAGGYDLQLCPLYVSRGVGTSLAPLRFGARPEIAVFRL